MATRETRAGLEVTNSEPRRFALVLGWQVACGFEALANLVKRSIKPDWTLLLKELKVLFRLDHKILVDLAHHFQAVNPIGFEEVVACPSSKQAGSQAPMRPRFSSYCRRLIEYM
jgi:hypothetical protein